MIHSPTDRNGPLRATDLPFAIQLLSNTGDTMSEGRCRYLITGKATVCLIQFGVSIAHMICFMEVLGMVQDVAIQFKEVLSRH